MIYDIDNLPKAFNLGRRGENLVTYIEIDCAAWLDEYEGATMGATIILPKQIEPVPLPIEQRNYDDYNSKYLPYLEQLYNQMGERKFDYDFNADPPNVTTSWEYAK